MAAFFVFKSGGKNKSSRRAIAIPLTKRLPWRRKRFSGVCPFPGDVSRQSDATTTLPAVVAVGEGTESVSMSSRTGQEFMRNPPWLFQSETVFPAGRRADVTTEMSGRRRLACEEAADGPPRVCAIVELGNFTMQHFHNTTIAQSSPLSDFSTFHRMNLPRFTKRNTYISPNNYAVFHRTP